MASKVKRRHNGVMAATSAAAYQRRHRNGIESNGINKSENESI